MLISWSSNINELIPKANCFLYGNIIKAFLFPNNWGALGLLQVLTDFKTAGNVPCAKETIKPWAAENSQWFSYLGENEKLQYGKRVIFLRKCFISSFALLLWSIVELCLLVPWRKGRFLTFSATCIVFNLSWQHVFFEESQSTDSSFVQLELII